MPKVDVLDIKGKKVSDIELADSVFGIEPNEAIVHSVLVNYLANQRQGTQSTKTRAEVSGGGKKPWRQKGTGRARQGSIRAPQWIKGGIALGPKPRSYKYTVNKKEKRLAAPAGPEEAARRGWISLRNYPGSSLLLSPGYWFRLRQYSRPDIPYPRSGSRSACPLLQGPGSSCILTVLLHVRY